MEYSLLSDRGGREVNEDRIDVIQNDRRAVFFLADGCGGHELGDVAAGLAQKAAKETADSDETDEAFFAHFFELASYYLHEEQKIRNAYSKLRTTVVLAELRDGNLRWAHIGDSRLYVFSHNLVRRRTRDHSVAQMMADCHEIKKKDIRHYPHRNLLTRVLGEREEKPSYTLSEELPVKKAQALLLCTDGFWEWIEEKEMCKALWKSKNAAEWLEKMRGIVLKHAQNCVGTGGQDNYSAIAVWL